jgi:hypothetical protein
MRLETSSDEQRSLDIFQLLFETTFKNWKFSVVLFFDLETNSEFIGIVRRISSGANSTLDSRIHILHQNLSD